MVALTLPRMILVYGPLLNELCQWEVSKAAKHKRIIKIASDCFYDIPLFRFARNDAARDDERT